MRKLIILILSLTVEVVAMAQPEPFPIDKSFSPELSFIQKQWYGEYNGVDPMSQARLSIKRTLCLCDDMTFTNITYGVITPMRGTQSEELLLRCEKGAYNYDENDGNVIYIVQADSALDMSAFLKNEAVEYIVNKYDSVTTENTYSVPAQFTFSTGQERQWVIIDSKLGSDQQQGKPAVYVMSCEEIDMAISQSSANERDIKESGFYDLNGRRHIGIAHTGNIIIKNGRKIVVRK